MKLKRQSDVYTYNLEPHGNVEEVQDKERGLVHQFNLSISDQSIDTVVAKSVPNIILLPIPWFRDIIVMKYSVQS